MCSSAGSLGCSFSARTAAQSIATIAACCRFPTTSSRRSPPTPSGGLPPIAPAVLPPYVPAVDVYSGDLALNIGLPPRYREPDFAPIVKIFVGPWPACGKRIDAGADEGYEIYACARPGLPRAVM